MYGGSMKNDGQELRPVLFEDEFLERAEHEVASIKENSFDSSLSFSCDVFELSCNAGNPLDTYPDKCRKEAVRRLSYIQRFKRVVVGGWTQKNLQPLLEDVEFLKGLDEPIPSWRTLAGWHSEFKKNGESVESLVPKHHKKGNRKNKKEDSDRYFQRALFEKYLRKERPSIRSAYFYYCDLVNLGNRGVVSGRIKPMSEKSFYDRVAKLPPYEVAVARYGKRYADRKYKPVGSHVQATRVLERVEIDHTALDLMLLDDELLVVLGRPYITALIDSYSKCLVGFYIGYKEPSYESVRKALLNAMLSKEYVKKRYPAVSCDWPCEGKIETLVVDNGAEFWSKSLEHACKSVVSDIQYNPVGRPWLKPLVERFFGQVNQKLLNAIPGKTFSGPEELNDYNSDKDAVMRFSTFMEVFHKWVIDVYHQDLNSRKDHVPIISWEQGFKDFPPLVYRGESEFQLRLDMAPTVDRVLGKDGIRFAGLRYSSDELDVVRKQTPVSGRSQGVKVKVKIDPDDLSKVYVFIPGRDGFLLAHAVDPDGYTVGLSLFQHQTNRRLKRWLSIFQVDSVTLSECRLSIDNVINNEVDLIRKIPAGKKSVRGMKKLARYSGVGSDRSSSVMPDENGNAKKRQEEQAEKVRAAKDASYVKILDDWDENVADWEPY